MNVLRTLFLFLLIVEIPFFAKAQSTSSLSNKELSLENVIVMAQLQSIDAMLAKHTYMSDFWQYKAYYAQLLPNLSLSAQLPSFNRSLAPVQNSETGEYNYVNNYMMLNSLSLKLSQNIAATGGKIELFSNIDRMDQYAPSRLITYNTSPINVIFTQPIGGFNALRWDKKIEPIRYEKAKFVFLEAMESISVYAVSLFFSQLQAQQKLEIAISAYQNMDTLYLLSKERFLLGSISKNELLQLEYRWLSQQQLIHDFQVKYDVAQAKLISYIRLPDSVRVHLKLPSFNPNVQIDPAFAFELSRSNTSLEYQHRIIEMEAVKEVAKAKSDRRPQIDLYARVGLNQVSDKFYTSFQNPLDQENVNIGVKVPIFDGQMAKGRVQMANSKLEIVKNQIEKEQVDNKQNLLLKVMEFNNQGAKCQLAKRSREVALERYNLSVQQFIMGSISVLDLNVAQTERDDAISMYVQELNNYWGYYFNLQQLCLYDFMTQTNISVLFDKFNLEKK